MAYYVKFSQLFTLDRLQWPSLEYAWLFSHVNMRFFFCQQTKNKSDSTSLIRQEAHGCCIETTDSSFTDKILQFSFGRQMITAGNQTSSLQRRIIGRQRFSWHLLVWRQYCKVQVNKEAQWQGAMTWGQSNQRSQWRSKKNYKNDSTNIALLVTTYYKPSGLLKI